MGVQGRFFECIQHFFLFETSNCYHTTMFKILYRKVAKECRSGNAWTYDRDNNLG